jgi:DNA-dependent protein kinase catalytic subunit
LFTEKKNENIFENIINIYDELKFSIETNFSNYKNKMEEINSKTVKKDLKYLSSQYLSDSSLIEQIPYMNTFSMTKNPEAPKKIVKNFNNIENLEMDIINLHVCMPTFIKIIDHLTLTFPKENDNKMPEWMKELHNKANNDETHVNIKLFIIKIILNRPKIFEKYLEDWFRIMIDTCLLTGNEINYFIRDVSLTLIEYNFVPKSKVDINSLNKLFSHLLKSCTNENKFIFISNLELIKFFVEKYKNILSFSKKKILGNILINILRLDLF